MPGGYGRKSFVGWDQEGTWGTGVAATKFAELINESMDIIRERVPRPVVRGLFAAREGNTYDAKFGAGGKFVIEGNFIGLLRLLEHAFGDASGSTAATEPGVRYTHTFNLKETPMTGKGLSLHINTDVDNGGTPQRRYNGFKIDSLKFSYDPRRNVQIEVGGAAKDHTDIAAVSATFPASAQYIAGHQTVLEIDDVATKFDSVDLTLNLALDLDKRIMGSKFIDEPVRDGQISIDGELNKDAAASDMTKFRDGTLFKVELISTGATLGAGTYKQTLIGLKAEAVGDPYKVTTPGLMKSRIPFRLLEPTAGETLQILIENNEAAIA